MYRCQECERIDRCLNQRSEEILIGPDPEDYAVSSWADNLLDEITLVLQEHKTEELEAIAAYRDKIYANGWMQRMIREYIEVWR